MRLTLVLILANSCPSLAFIHHRLQAASKLASTEHIGKRTMAQQNHGDESRFNNEDEPYYDKEQYDGGLPDVQDGPYGHAASGMIPFTDPALGSTESQIYQFLESDQMMQQYQQYYQAPVVDSSQDLGNAGVGVVRSIQPLSRRARVITIKDAEKDMEYVAKGYLNGEEFVELRQLQLMQHYAQTMSNQAREMKETTLEAEFRQINLDAARKISLIRAVSSHRKTGNRNKPISKAQRPGHQVTASRFDAAAYYQRLQGVAAADVSFLRSSNNPSAVSAQSPPAPQGGYSQEYNPQIPYYSSAPPNADGSYDVGKHRRLRKRQPNMLDMLKENGSSNDGTSNRSSNSTMQEQVEKAYSYMQTVRTNISALIFPVLTNLTEGTTDPSHWWMAWSVYADLTMSEVMVFTPFRYGSTCLEWLESLEKNATSASNSSSAASVNHTEIAEYDDELMLTYAELWNGCQEALNQTTLRSDLLRLSYYMMLPTDLTPPELRGINSEADPNARYFLDGVVSANKGVLNATAATNPNAGATANGTRSRS